MTDLDEIYNVMKAQGVVVKHGHSVISLNTDVGPYVCVKCREQRDECTFNNEPCPADFIPSMRSTIPKRKS